MTGRCITSQFVRLSHLLAREDPESGTAIAGSHRLHRGMVLVVEQDKRDVDAHTPSHVLQRRYQCRDDVPPP